MWDNLKFLSINKGAFTRSSMTRFPRRIWYNYVAFHTLSAFKMRMAALVGMVGFPLFYVLYTWITPQHYENLELRITGFVVSALLGLSSHWPAGLKRYLPHYSYLFFLFALPFFFTFMLLMNDASTVWQVSTMAAFVYVALLYDSANTIVISIVGSLLGCLAYGLAAGWQPLPEAYLQLLPVILFALCGLILLNSSDSRIADEKMQAASRLASHIAHEMRTPLLGIKFDAERVDQHIPLLTEAHTWALANGFDSKKLTAHQIAGLQSSMRRIQNHTRSANLVIDMLLVNADQENIASGMYDLHSARTVVQTALDHYHFREGEKDRVLLVGGTDFQFFGSDLLLMHTLFNLIKNGMRAIETVGGRGMEIELVTGEIDNRILVRDDGPGIAPDVLNHIFVPFFTGEHHGEGTGIGLAFSKYVIESFGGGITCRSQSGHGAEFTISLPIVPPGTEIAELEAKRNKRPQKKNTDL